MCVRGSEGLFSKGRVKLVPLSGRPMETCLQVNYVRKRNGSPESDVEE